MRNIVIGIAPMVLAVEVWAAAASWQWSHASSATAFEARIASELSENARFTVRRSPLLSADLSDTARMVCGTLKSAGPDDLAIQPLYSLIFVNGAFGKSIDDGFAPATPPEAQAKSDRTCAAFVTPTAHA